jgi:hypothetical protein
LFLLYDVLFEAFAGFGVFDIVSIGGLGAVLSELMGKWVDDFEIKLFFLFESTEFFESFGALSFDFAGLDLLEGRRVLDFEEG